jgi:hypothetical protein
MMIKQLQRTMLGFKIQSVMLAASSGAGIVDVGGFHVQRGGNFREQVRIWYFVVFNSP